jgi:P-type Ca2+ transporter type 2C
VLRLGMLEDTKGLTTHEAQKRLVRYGQNILPEKPPPSGLSIFLSQLKNPLVYVLIFSGLITLILKHYSDTAIILLAVLINSVLGFFQESKASRALYELKKLVQPTTKVLRDGKVVTLDASKIVPGDVVILSQGDKIPADGELLYANRLLVDEALLTGESVPVTKNQSVNVFMATIVLSGKGEMVVGKTGENSEVGKIAKNLQEKGEDTPLKKQLIIFSRQLVTLILLLTVFVFLAGLIRGRDIYEMFTASIALAVSAIPEGLLVGLTVVLAIGMQRILKKNGLVRNLVSAETLGGVTTICVDKTGTLTQGKMKVVSFSGNREQIMLQSIVANDMDDSIVIGAWEWASAELTGKSKKSETNDFVKKHKQIDSIPFSPKERFFASLNTWDEKNNMLFVNGAPEFLLEWSDVGANEKKKILAEIAEMTAQGRRILGFARKTVPLEIKRISDKDAKQNLEWVGVLAFADPVRLGVKAVLDKAYKAGVKTVIITGDYSETALFVAKELGLFKKGDIVISGSELSKMSRSELKGKLLEGNVRLFARTTPEQKLTIVEALKENGEVVAMMGDGVNDAPALKAADIGIVVSEATDVSKESADLVLMDSKFETVLEAVEEGRGIFDNIRKIIMYLMSTAFNEITAVLGAIVLGFPLPATAAQILWINIVSDGFPNMALAVEPKRRGIMSEPPRPPSEPLVNNWMKQLIGIVSVTSGILSLMIFVYAYTSSDDLVLARSIGFVSLGVNSLVYVFSIRTLKDPFWVEGFFDNKWLIASVGAGFILQLLPFMTQTGRDFFGVTTIPVDYWIAIFAISLFMIILIEILKSYFRRVSVIRS